MSSFWLNKITYDFSQEGNTDGTTDRYEELVVEVQGPSGSILEEGGYLVLRTPTGWSINNLEELTDLLKIVESGVPCEQKIQSDGE